MTIPFSVHTWKACADITAHHLSVNPLPDDNNIIQKPVSAIEYEDGFFFKNVPVSKKIALAILAFICCIIIACITFVVCHPENIEQLIGLIID